MSAKRSLGVVRAALVAVLLLAAVAGAAPVQPPFIRHVSGTAEGLVDKEDLRASKAWYEEWRRGAGRFAELLWANEEVRRRVGEPLDTRGLHCILWTKMAELVNESRTVLSRRFDARGEPLPAWITKAHTRAHAKAKEECSSRGDGDGGLRPENLGVLYLREWKRLQQVDASRREAVAVDAETLHALSRVAETWEALAPTARGVAPAAPVLPLINPCLVQPSLCKQEVGNGI
jgi:hypothetical protein